MGSPLRTVAVAAVLLFTAACAGGYAGSFVPSPEEIPELREEVDRDPRDVAAAVRLGAGLREVGELEEAREVLEGARNEDPDDPSVVLFLGLTYEDLNRPSDAIEFYENYLEVGRNREVRRALERRIPVLRRQELRVAAQVALAREESLAQVDPEPNRVGVFPFLFAGTEESLAPLSRALAEMLATDLAQTDRLEVLERVQVQALLDEMALAESGFVEEATAARSGRMLGAGRIVQGRIDGDLESLGMAAAVVGVETGAARELGTVSERDVATQFFQIEKELAFGIFETLGITLTTAERARVNQRYTENLQALLAYGQGLMEMDRGNYAAARERFEEAVELDPEFQQAKEQAALAFQAESVAGTPTTAIADLAVESMEDLPSFNALELGQQIANQAVGRDPVQEASGTDNPPGGDPGRDFTVFLRLRGGF